jgi:dTMP kinase
VRVLATREPGGTKIGERIRAVLLDPENCDILAETEALLYAAARAQHVREVVQPALAAGTAVVGDRYVDSSLAYQGAGRGLPLEALQPIQALATGGLVPDLRVLLDVPVAVGLGRRLGTTEVNRLDAEDRSFHERVRGAFREMAKADPAGWVVIDATGEPRRIAQEVEAAVWERLGARLPRESDGVGEQ